jgi:hypothetical protein
MFHLPLIRADGKEKPMLFKLGGRHKNRLEKTEQTP